MPITIKQAQLQYKDPTTSEYVPVAAIADYASIPVATYLNAGIIKTNTDFGTNMRDAPNQDTLMVVKADSANIKAATQRWKPIVPYHQHESVFYGLAKAAGDSTQAASDNAVGTYTADAKSAIKLMLGVNVDDVQINGTSVVNNGVANIPIADYSTLGVVKTHGMGIYANTAGELSVVCASSATIKVGTNQYSPIVPGNQHEAIFYGLAKAAGDTTQASSNNAVGTYTAEAKTAIRTMLDVPSTDSPVFTGSFSIGRRANTRVGDNSVAMGAGNTVEGAFSCAIGSSLTANGYCSFCEGTSNQALAYATHAEGLSTIARGGYSHSEGFATTANGEMSHSEGNGTVTEGYTSHAEGLFAYALGFGSHAEGQYTVATGSNSHVSGCFNVYDDFSNLPEWTAGTSYAVGNQVKMTKTIGNRSYILGYSCSTANSDQTFTQYHWNQLSPRSYVEVVGNGADESHRSNARAVDWDGNEKLNGYLYVGCNSDSTGGTRVPHDVQMNGTSIVTNGVANVPLATRTTPGVTIPSGMGVSVNNAGELYLFPASSGQVKAGTNIYVPIMPYNQHESVFYGLAKAAGDSGQSASNNAVGTYTEEAKSAISEMLNAPVTVSGSTPQITANAGIRYVCGEVSSLSFTPSQTGICDVIFTSGSTATTLTIPNTVKFPSWFDKTSLDTNTTYEINIMDGVYGAVMTWT